MKNEALRKIIYNHNNITPDNLEMFDNNGGGFASNFLFNSKNKIDWDLAISNNNKNRKKNFKNKSSITKTKSTHFK